MQKLLRLFDSISKYLLAAIIIVIPLFPKFPFITIPGTYVSIRIEDSILLILGIITLIKLVVNYKSVLRNKIVQAFAVFFGVGFISLLAGSFITKTTVFSLGLLHLIRRIEYVVPFFAAIYLIPKDKIGEYLRFFVKLLTIVILVAFVYGFGQRYLHFPVIVTQNEEYSKGIALYWTAGSHINSTFAGHYDLAAYIVLLLPVIVLGIFLLKDFAAKIIFTLASGAGLWLLVNSVSRIAQVSYILGVSVAFFLTKKLKLLILVLLVSALAIGFSSDLKARFARVIEVFSQKIGIQKIISFTESRFVVLAEDSTLPLKRDDAPVPTPTPIPVFEDRSTSIRFAVEWPRAVRAFEKNPLLGTGYSSITLATDNDYLRILGETGILGFLSFWLVFFWIGKVLLKALPLEKKFSGMEKIFLAGIFGGVMGTFLSAFFIDLFEASKLAITFWLMLGIAVRLIQSKLNVE